MPIFVQGSGEERDIAELFLKLKDSEKALTHVFDRADYQLIDKCLKELEANLLKQEQVQDPIKECHYIVDQVVYPDGQTELEPNFGLIQTNVWKKRFILEFLDSKRSHLSFRAFDVTSYSASRCIYSNYKYIILDNYLSY